MERTCSGKDINKNLRPAIVNPPWPIEATDFPACARAGLSTWHPPLRWGVQQDISSPETPQFHQISLSKQKVPNSFLRFKKDRPRHSIHAGNNDGKTQGFHSSFTFCWQNLANLWQSITASSVDIKRTGSAPNLDPSVGGLNRNSWTWTWTWFKNL